MEETYDALEGFDEGEDEEAASDCVRPQAPRLLNPYSEADQWL
ncbi:hypothetical protein [Streptomyces nigrescens]